jgi:hypothetical protein
MAPSPLSRASARGRVGVGRAKRGFRIWPLQVNGNRARDAQRTSDLAALAPTPTLPRLTAGEGVRVGVQLNF